MAAVVMVAAVMAAAMAVEAREEATAAAEGNDQGNRGNPSQENTVICRREAQNSRPVSSRLTSGVSRVPRKKICTWHAFDRLRCAPHRVEDGTSASIIADAVTRVSTEIRAALAMRSSRANEKSDQDKVNMMQRAAAACCCTKRSGTIVLVRSAVHHAKASHVHFPTRKGLPASQRSFSSEFLRYMYGSYMYGSFQRY